MRQAAASEGPAALVAAALVDGGVATAVLFEVTFYFGTFGRNAASAWRARMRLEEPLFELEEVLGATLRSGSDGKSVTELHNVGAITLALLDDEAHANLDKKRSGSDEDTGCESDELSEPSWLADLLDEFDVGTDRGDRRHFVETRVRAASCLSIRLATTQRCTICLDAARGAMMQPCNHAAFCGACAARVLDGPAHRRMCPVCAMPVAGWCTVFV